MKRINIQAALDEPSRDEIEPIEITDGLPAAVVKAYSKRCKACVSVFYDKINSMLVAGRGNSYIAKWLARRGEVVTPQAIGRHKKNHLHDRELIRGLQLARASMDTREELVGQINRTKIEVEETADRDFRKYLYQRIDKLMKLLVDYDTRMVRAKAGGAVFDNSKKTINVVQGGKPSGSRQVENVLARELISKLEGIEGKIASGELVLVDGESSDMVEEPRKEGSVLFDEPFQVE